MPAAQVKEDVQDRTTCEPFRTRDPEPHVPPVDTLLDNRSRERYVPKDVTCANCGVEASGFDWFQRIPARDIDGQRPTRDRHFCCIVCVGLYLASRFPNYDPDLEPVGVAYD